MTDYLPPEPTETEILDRIRMNEQMDSLVRRRATAFVARWKQRQVDDTEPMVEDLVDLIKDIFHLI